MAWRRTGAKPLPGPMLTRFADALGGDELSSLNKGNPFANDSLSFVRQQSS